MLHTAIILTPPLKIKTCDKNWKKEKEGETAHDIHGLIDCQVCHENSVCFKIDAITIKDIDEEPDCSEESLLVSFNVPTLANLTAPKETTEGYIWPIDLLSSGNNIRTTTKKVEKCKIFRS